MVYESFLQTIKTKLEHQLGNSYAVTLRRISKNNGVLLDGLCISRKGEKIAPTIYLNDYFPLYQSGTSLPDILGQIITLYKENTEIPAINFSRLTEFHEIKDKIVFKLIHKKSNIRLLKGIPHVSFLDLAVVFYILLDNCEDGQMTALIHNEHMSLWNTNTQELYKIATENAPRHLPAVIKNMNEVMREIAKANLGEDFKDEYLEDLMKEDDGQTPLYVLSNPSGFYGASCMLYDGVLKNFSDTTDSDFIILPSSIHEVLLLPAANQSDCQEFGDMVTKINHHEVSTEDRLSNQVYYYSKKDDRITIACLSSGTDETENP